MDVTYLMTLVMLAPPWSIECWNNPMKMMSLITANFMPVCGINFGSNTYQLSTIQETSLIFFKDAEKASCLFFRIIANPDMRYLDNSISNFLHAYIKNNHTCVEMGQLLSCCLPHNEEPIQRKELKKKRRGQKRVLLVLLYYQIVWNTNQISPYRTQEERAPKERCEERVLIEWGVTDSDHDEGDKRY